MDERVSDLENLAKTLAPLPGHVAELGNRVAGVETRLGTVESQIVQLRADMGDEFSAIRGELKGGLQAVKTELREDIASLGRETAAGFLRAGVEMRALFEEHLGRRAREIAARAAQPTLTPTASGRGHAIESALLQRPGERDARGLDSRSRKG